MKTSSDYAREAAKQIASCSLDKAGKEDYERIIKIAIDDSTSELSREIERLRTLNEQVTGAENI